MSQLGRTSSLTLCSTTTDSQLGKLSPAMETDKQNGLSDGGRRRRRSSSSGDSDLVVLSVVFNKKKQKQNDEVAIAIERLRENGVNCVLFTMNDFRNGNRKSESVITDPFRVSSGNQNPSFHSNSSQARTTSGSFGHSSDKSDPKVVSPVALMPALPSIKCEISENSNGSTDSSTSSNADIHKTVERVINSFSPSPSPSPPPLSPQLPPLERETMSENSTGLAIGKAESPTLHQLLSPLLGGPPVLAHEASPPSAPKLTCDAHAGQRLQETQICSSSSTKLCFASGNKRRKRRTRKCYSSRKGCGKKRNHVSTLPKVKVNTTNLTEPNCDTMVEVIPASSSDDPVKPDLLLLPSPQNFPLDLVKEKVAQVSQNEVSSTSNVENTTPVKVELKSIEVKEEPSSSWEGAHNPVSSSTVIEARRKKALRQKRNRFGRRKKKTTNLRLRKDLRAEQKQTKDQVMIVDECKVDFEPSKQEDFQQSLAAAVVLGEVSSGDSKVSKDVDVDDDDEDDHIPLASLLQRKRAFSPDIIRGVKEVNSGDLMYSSSTNWLGRSNSDKPTSYLRQVVNRTSGTHNSQGTEAIVKRSKLEEEVKAPQCVQNDEEEEISDVNNVQVANTLECPSLSTTTTTTMNCLKEIPKRKAKKKRARLVVRRNRNSRKRKKNPGGGSDRNELPLALSPQILDEYSDDPPLSMTSILDTVQMGPTLPPIFPSEKDQVTSPQVKDEISSGSTDDDSVPSVDSGLPSSESLSCTEEFKLENDESSGGSSADSGINADDKSILLSVAENLMLEVEPVLRGDQLGSCKRADDSLPATPDGMQLRRSNFYSLISDNVRKNLENYLDGRMAPRGPSKRRKRTKNSYLLNHGDNYPDDPEAPYRLHMATQVLLKLNKRRAKCKPKEDRGKSLLSYLKLVPKRPPRTGKPVPASPPGESEDASEEPVFSGEWTIPRKYVCHVCGQIEENFWDMVMHKGEQHPGVVVTHTELTGTVPQSLVRVVPAPPVAAEEDTIPPCSKCQAQFSTMPDLHRHIFECAGNASWLETEKVPRKKKSKRRRGFKRRLSNTTKNTHTPTKAKKNELPRRRPSEVFRCEFCPREFKTEGWLKNHLVTHSLPVSIPLEKLSLPSRASNNSISSRLFK